MWRKDIPGRGGGRGKAGRSLACSRRGTEDRFGHVTVRVVEGNVGDVGGGQIVQVLVDQGVRFRPQLT